MAALEGTTGQPDWAKWYAEKYGVEANYSALLDQLASTPDERRSILHSYIEPTDEDVAEGRKVPTRAHHAIAKLVRAGFIRVIITTNFDRLMENALREAGIEPTVIKSDDDLKGAVPLTHSRCYVVKVHGDYLDTRIRNTDQELGAYSPAMDALLDRSLAIAAEWLLFQITHEKSFPLHVPTLRRELATPLHIKLLQTKVDNGFYQKNTPSTDIMAQLNSAREWLIEVLS